MKADAIFCRAKAETNREIFERFIMTQTVKCEKYIKLLEGYIEKAKISKSRRGPYEVMVLLQPYNDDLFRLCSSLLPACSMYVG